MINFTPSGSTNTGDQNDTPYLANDTIFIKEGHDFHKVKFDEITYLSSDHVYVTIHTTKKKFLVRASLQKYLEKFDPAKFVRVHQRYAVNINKVEKINSIYLIVNNEEIPISKSYHHTLLGSLNLG